MLGIELVCFMVLNDLIVNIERIYNDVGDRDNFIENAESERFFKNL